MTMRDNKDGTWTDMDEMPGDPPLWPEAKPQSKYPKGCPTCGLAMEDVVAGVEKRLYDGSTFMGKPVGWWMNVKKRMEELGIFEAGQIEGPGSRLSSKADALVICLKCDTRYMVRQQKDGTVFVPGQCSLCGNSRFRVEAPCPC